ncbi:hypothetical protein E4U22_007271 [Claviceps purpurea]|nr:hypothetical protein E4U22_007271 [Claviceps purpurea]
MLPHHGSNTENFKIQPKRARKASQKEAKEKPTVDKENVSPLARDESGAAKIQCTSQGNEGQGHHTIYICPDTVES